MKSRPNIDKKLEKEIAKKCVMTAQELIAFLGNKMQLKRKSDEGILLPLGSGLYAPFIKVSVILPVFLLPLTEGY